jgi:hypothetical protein
MVQNPAPGAHSASCQHNHGPFSIHYLLVLFVVPHRIQIIKIQGMVTASVQISGFFIPERGLGMVESGQFQSQRTVRFFVAGFWFLVFRKNTGA